jgi:DNA-binding response OmpR family regulator
MTPRRLVLVADDDADILELVSVRMALFGYDVVQAQAGDQALELALERRPDLIVLDVMMPGLTGYEVTKRLRAAEETATTPILLLTASVREEHEARGLGVGANAFMRKPFESAELEACARALLAGDDQGTGTT